MKLAALIVETRPLPNLVKLIKDHMIHLPEDTQLIIYHGAENHLMLEDAFPEAIRHVIGTMSIQLYNNLLTSEKFWESLLKWDKVIIFQHDSMILRKGVEEFYDYDMVGAPWSFQATGCNGGMSLRTPKIMFEIVSNHPLPQGWNEDVHICRIMTDYNIGNLAPREVGMKFGTEGIFSLGTFSYHAIDTWLTRAECDQIRNQYKTIPLSS